jgi:copper homeostasis protein
MLCKEKRQLNMTPILEVIACSLTDAIEAEKGGAGRLEIVSALGRGGLTPSFDLVAAIKQRVHIPVRVMLRESDGFGIAGESEVESLCAAAERFASLRVDGFVLGFLRDGEVDVELTRRVLAHGPDTPATFHHAFEATRDKSSALSAIKQLAQVDRVLSHGGTDGLDLRVQRLQQYATMAGPELIVLAGGGINAGAISRISRETNIREFHVGRAARSRFQVEGSVEASLVRALVNSLNQQ